MARLRDIKVGMKVQIVKGKEKPEDFDHYDAWNYIGDIGVVISIDLKYPLCAVKIKTDNSIEWWYPASWIKIIKDEGEVKMTKPKTEVKPQKYILIDDNDVSQVFTEATTKGISDTAEDSWGWDQYETMERLKDGKMKLFKIEEVKIEVTEPSIKIIG